MLDAGVDLRDVQIAAPRTTMRYDRARNNLDRHPDYILAAFMASGIAPVIRSRRRCSITTMFSPRRLATLIQTFEDHLGSVGRRPGCDPVAGRRVPFDLSGTRNAA